MKRILYILSVLLVSILLVCTMLVCALMSDTVETAAVQLATREISKSLGTTAQVGRVEYHFPARVSLHDVYIEDLQGDTLLYTAEIYAHFRPLALRNDEIRFSHVRLSDAVIKVYRVESQKPEDDSEWNYQFLLDALKSD